MVKIRFCDFLFEDFFIRYRINIFSFYSMLGVGDMNMFKLVFLREFCYM